MKIKKLISCILVCMLLLGGAVGLLSCVKEGAGEQESEDTTENTGVQESDGTTEDTADTETEDTVEVTESEEATESASDSESEEIDTSLKIVENGKSEYVVVYPNDASSEVLNVMDVMISEIEKHTGVALRSKSDNLRGAASHDPNEKAILIGRTNYDESQEVLDTLGRKEYKIAQNGNKMVIVAMDDSSLSKAINYYISKLIEPNVTGEDGAKTLRLEEYHYVPKSSELDYVIINGTDISEYCIIYPEDDVEYKTIGTELQESVLKKLGVMLHIYSDSKAEQPNEILLGKTNRAFSQKLYSDLSDYLMTYSIEVSGAKLQILGGGYYSTKQCVYDMQFSVLTNGEFNFTDGSHMKTKVLANPTELTEGADIRILNANLLHSDWAGNRLSVKYRAEIFAGVLRDIKPDAIGMQEIDPVWRTELKPYLKLLKEEYGLEYTFRHEKTPDGRNSLITIMYRSDMYNCVEEDYVIFSHWQPNQGISIPMCRFQSKTDSSKEFILMNTHWEVDSLASADKANCSKETADFVNKWKSAGCPIFITGDWNAIRGRDCIEDFITATDAQTADTGTYCIEFIFYFGDSVTAVKNQGLGQYVAMTDHAIRYTDFDLW